MKRHIPNCITLLNQMSGIIAVIAAYNYSFGTALLFMTVGALFDFFDGMAARLLHVTSPMGKELDSLADMISFGLLPGMVAFRLLSPLAETWQYLPYIGFSATLFSALRLAKFNIDTRQTDSFIGLATPANAILWTGMAYGFPDLLSTVPQWTIVASLLITSYLLISEIPMFSLKFHNLHFKENSIRYIFLAGAAVLAAVFRLKSLPFMIIWYMLLSFGTAIAGKTAKKRASGCDKRC